MPPSYTSTIKCEYNYQNNLLADGFGPSKWVWCRLAPWQSGNNRIGYYLWTNGGVPLNYIEGHIYIPCTILVAVKMYICIYLRFVQLILLSLFENSIWACKWDCSSSFCGPFSTLNLQQSRVWNCLRILWLHPVSAQV